MIFSNFDKSVCSYKYISYILLRNNYTTSCYITAEARLKGRSFAQTLIPPPIFFVFIFSRSLFLEGLGTRLCDR